MLFNNRAEVELLIGKNKIQKARKTALANVVKMNEAFQCQTMEGLVEGKPGDYLAIGVKDEVYPIAAAVFEASYEIVSDEPVNTVAPEMPKLPRFDMLTLWQANEEKRPFEFLSAVVIDNLLMLVVEYTDVPSNDFESSESIKRIREAMGL